MSIVRLKLLILVITSLLAQKSMAQQVLPSLFSHVSNVRASKAAKHSQKLIFAFIHTDWSVESKRMIDSTFTNPYVVNELSSDYETVALNGAKKRKFTQKYNIHSFPTYLVLDWKGSVLIRSTGYKKPKELLAILAKTRSNSRFLRQNLDSLAAESTTKTILHNLDSIKYYKGEYEAKNLAKKYLDRKDVDWRDPESMVLIKDYFHLNKKYLKFISKYHFKFFERFDSLKIKEDIAFHVFLNSLKTDRRGRSKFDYKPVRKWFRKHRIRDVDKLENFVKIKHLLWGRGPSVSRSINLISNYPETTDEDVLFASVIRLLISNSKRRIDYDELILSLKNSVKEDGTFWRYDLLSLLYYKNGNNSKSNDYIKLATNIAELTSQSYQPTLPLIKDIIITE